MSDTVALALIALFGSINVTIGLMTHRKLRACGDKACIKAVQDANSVPSNADLAHIQVDS